MSTSGKVIPIVILALGIVGVVLFVLGFVFGFSSALDGVINSQIESSVRLERGTDQFNRWEELPFPLHFKVYAFHVVNPDAILEGARPIVQEVGPFVYNQYRRKENIQYDRLTDTYTYTQRQVYEFNEELSAFSEDTTITVLNIALQGVFLTINETVAVLVNEYWRDMFGGDGYFLNIPAKSLFFEGYQFCETTNLDVPSIICRMMREAVEDSKTITYDDTYTYTQRQVYEFNEELSAFSEDTTITVLNIALQGVFLTINETVAVLVNEYWRDMFGGDGYFLNIPAKSLFFEGYQFCETTNLDVPSIICRMMREAVEDSKTITYDGERYRFSFFGHKNNSDDGFYNVSGGNLDINTLGAIRSWEYTQELQAWDGENSPCNRIRGRDSSIYPPFNNDSSNFDIFNTDICRIVNLKTTGNTTYEDIEAIVATLGIDEMANDGDKSCYCIKKTLDINAEAECLPKGFADMQSCLAAPILASFPHMLWADTSYSSTVLGLLPNPDKHQTFVALEPNTGTPLQGAKRLQFNTICRPITNLDITQSLNRSVFPVIWVEEGFNLPEEQVQQIKDDYFSRLRMLDNVSYALIGVGAALMVICMLYFIYFTYKKFCNK
ncbi:CD36 family [Popillia japonica]|uniref:Sensory neuron membrane protein 2 n=1 Tax=Popillia japonica TaxID=7064 RepID=A0AAW1LQH7_POPJA